MTVHFWPPRLGAQARMMLLNLTGAAAFGAAWLQGWANVPFQQDQTWISTGIAVVFLIGLVQAWRGRWRTVRWTEEALVMLGLIGTVIGMSIALASLDASAADDVEAARAMINAVALGFGTALYTTLVGAVGALWLYWLEHLFDDQA